MGVIKFLTANPYMQQNRNYHRVFQTLNVGCASVCNHLDFFLKFKTLQSVSSYSSTNIFYFGYVRTD
jgi:hypothetical protein